MRKLHSSQIRSLTGPQNLATVLTPQHFRNQGLICETDQEFLNYIQLYLKHCGLVAISGKVIEGILYLEVNP